MIRSVLVGLGSVVLLVALYVPFAVFAAGSGWTDYSDIRFTQMKEFTDVAQRPTTLSGANRDCTNRELVVRPAKNNLLLPDQNEIKSSLCVVDTTFGTVSGYTFQRPETAVAGPLLLRTNKEFLLAGNNVNSYILAEPSAPTGVYISFAESLLFDTAVNNDGTVQHFLKNPNSVTNVMNARGERLSAMQDTAAFSANGKWLVFDSPSYGFVRMNVENGSILSFGFPTNYNLGSNPGFQTAISSDGRYVAISAQGMLNIYDLSDCKSQTGPNAHLQNCKTRSLEDKRQTLAPYGRYAAYVRFSVDDSITYYVAELRNNAITYRQYRITMGDMPQYGYDYLGLGDSFASGEGAFNYKNITDTDENKCHTSALSYPYLVGTALAKEDFESVACSGAKLEDIDSFSANDYEGQIKDGITQVERDKDDIFSSLLPGKITQNLFVNKLNPETITISVGGNDIGFADKITDCVSNLLDTTCFNTYEDRQEVVSEINGLVPELVKTYQKLKENNRRVYVLGYPKIIKPNGNCANNVKLNNTETDFADKITELLNDAVETATKQAGVGYVDVENILQGRRLCETDSSNALVHGVTQGNDSGIWKVKVIAKESFHPKAEAHELYQAAILAQTNNLTKPMPASDPSAKFAVPAATSAYWAVEKTNRPVYYPHYQDIVSDRTNLGSNIDVNLKNTGLKPLSSVNAELHSAPQNLGSFTTDENGDLDFDITLPALTPPGFHSLHIYGQTTTGQKIDIYDYFFVGSDQNDLDGDGVPDGAEGCMLVEPSGSDSDKDGVDDVCDAVVDPLPPEEPEQNPDEELPPDQPPEETDDPTPLPVVIPVEPPKIIGNDETVAGNEELVVEDTPAQIETASVNNTTSSSTPQTQSGYQFIQPAGTNTTGSETEDQEVLGTSDTQPDPATQQLLAENADGPQQGVETDSQKSWTIYWVIGGITALLALILVFIARKKQTS